MADLSVATCHIQYTFLSLCQVCSRENGQNTKILEVRYFRMLRKWPCRQARKPLILRMSHWSRSQANVVTKQREQMFASDAESKDGIERYVNSLPAEHRSSAKDWLETGVILPSKHLRKNLTCEKNPLTGFSQFGSVMYCLLRDGTTLQWRFLMMALHRKCTTHITHILVKCAPKLMKGKVCVRVCELVHMRVCACVSVYACAWARVGGGESACACFCWVWIMLIWKCQPSLQVSAGWHFRLELCL